MVNIEIPKHYTASPSSFSGTPSLTINHGAIKDLDSSEAFEGPEKLLEVWFTSSATTLPATSTPDGLRAVPAAVWEDMLDLVNCKVLSTIQSAHVDAYLLSESSMFVFPHKIILKTCGKTTLLSGLPRMLEIAATEGGFPHQVANQSLGTATAAIPYRVFYSRKNFIFPDCQRGPHRSWRDEVKSLDRLFQGGSAYMIGKMNGDHWYLYLTSPNTMLTPPATPERTETPTKMLDLPMSKASIAACTAEGEGEDETLELLMTDLEPENAKQFYLDHASAVAEGQYHQKAREAEAVVQEHMGSLKEQVNGNAHDQLKPIAEEETDVFSNTSSDPADLMRSSTNDMGPYPIDPTTEGHVLGTVVSESSGLADVYPASKYPDARIDAYMFAPCGFSANGVIPAPQGKDATHYFNVHVTPEPDWSYASFETNVPSNQSGPETANLIEQVVSIFQPGRFSVTRFEGKQQFLDDHNFSTDGSEAEPTASKIETLEKQVARRGSRLDRIKGYRRVDRIVHDLEGYELVFKYYERLDWEGGAPRLGEAGF